jgi:hypothetical protein
MEPVEGANACYLQQGIVELEHRTRAEGISGSEDAATDAHNKQIQRILTRGQNRRV